MRNLILLTTLICVSWSAQAQTLTEAKLASMVEKGNARVLAARQRWDSARAQQNALTRSFLPDVTASGGAETFKTGVESQRDETFGSVGAELNLYRGGRDAQEEKARTAEARRAESEYRQIHAAELKEARKLFWDAVFGREMLVTLEATLKRNDEMLSSAKRRIQSGIATETDRYEFEMNRTQLEQDHMRLKLGVSRAERRLKAQLGLLEAAPLELPDRIPHDHDDALPKSTWNAADHPEAQAARYESEATRSQARIARRWWMPSVDLYGNYSLYTFREREFDARRDRDESVAGAKVTVPLFNGFRSRAAARGATLTSDAQANQALQLAREHQADFLSAKEELSMLHDQIHSAEEAVEQGRKYLSGTRSEYTRGVKNSPDVLGALEKTLELEHRFADIRRDYQFVRADLLYLLGQ